MRVKITLRCNECKQRNYNTIKNKKNTPDKLELNKYCPFCRKKRSNRKVVETWQKKTRRRKRRTAASGSVK